MVFGSKGLQKAKDKILDSMAQTLTLKLIHGRNVYEVTLPCYTSFGQLKEYAHSVTNIPLQDIRLKGRSRKDDEALATARVKQGSQVFVGESEEYKAAMAAAKEAEELAALEREQRSLQRNHATASARGPAPGSRSNHASASASANASANSTPRQQERFEAQQPQNFARWPAAAQQAAPTPERQAAAPQSEAEKSLAAIKGVTQQVDVLEAQVQSLPAGPQGSKEAVKLAEVLTQKLLTLDSVAVTPETRQLRKAQINRINALCDRLEALKLKLQEGGSQWTQF